TVDDAEMRLHLTAALKAAVVTAVVAASRQRNRTLDRFDNLRDVDRGRRPRKPYPAAAATRGDKQTGARKAAHQPLRSGARNPGLLSEQGRVQRDRSALSRGGAHQHHGIIGKV